MTIHSLRQGFIALAVALTVCAPVSADMVGPPEVLAGVEPTGACCKFDGVCIDNVTQLNCEQIGSAWGGAGSTCISNICGPIGGCCLNGVCDFGESQRYCEFGAGGHWHPTCGDPGCNPLGACCLDHACVDQTENLCFLNGGIFFGGGTTCVSESCVGACCLPNFAGCSITLESECNAVEGSFQGHGSTCNGFVCSGACCLGPGFCQELSEYDCFITEGVFVGGPCENAVCGFPTGACCNLSGTCSDGIDQGLCIEFNGAFGGTGSTCAQINCQDAGSCCIEFIPGSFFCIPNIFEDACINQQGGTFNGAGTDCSPNPCGAPVTTGACCLFNGTCEVITPDHCASQKGLYKGDATDCTPSVCCPADFNNDGAVNTPDLTYFLGRFGSSFPPPGSEKADLVPDGVVNTLDLTRFLGAFGRSCPY